MRNKTLAVFAIGLILLAACGRQAQNTMTETQALDTLTSVTELNSFNAALGRKPKPQAPKVSVAELQKLLVQLIQEGKIKIPSQARGATSSTGQDIANAINAINAIFAAIPQTNGTLSAFTLALSIMAQFSGSLSSGTFDLNTLVSILNQALPYIVAFAPQYAPLVQALIVIIPLVVTIINTLQPPKAMLNSVNFNHA